MMGLTFDSILLKRRREKQQMADDVHDSKKTHISKDLLVVADELSVPWKTGVTRMTDDDLHKIDYPEVWKELIVGAEGLSTFLYGTPDKARSVYHIVEKSNTLPTFRLGSKIAAFKSTIRSSFWAQQRRVFRDQKEADLVQLGVLLLKLLTLVRTANGNGTAMPASGDVHLWMAVLTETSRAIDRILMSR
jgi:hypothetical protein